MEALAPFYGMFSASNTGIFVAASLIILTAIGFVGSPLIVWTIAIGAILIGFGAPTVVLCAFAIIAVWFNVKPIRAMTASKVVMWAMKKFKIMPTISETERTALEAGVVWIESDLFSGKPDFKKILNEPYPQLTPEEKAFMQGPVRTLCNMIHDYDIWKTKEIPENVWNYIRKEKFLGMIIPKEYGGLGFSALAHSEVIAVISSRSIPAAVSVMVPNSLGPAELLIHYGTDQQKKDLLPKLASGDEIPCFALTEPNAGSDAGAIQADGVIFKGPDGKLYIKLNWNKRWITLAAISTTLGLAFKLKDPENLLGKGADVGITCALIPTKTPGVVIGRRHDPLGCPFYNCPTQGKDVVVPIDYIVGGAGGAGKGWKMLMECLAAGRGVSLPAQSIGGAKMATRVISAHAVVRKQFGVSIGKFEGVEEPIARIAGRTYLLEAFRRFTLGALDKGIKPPVITAIGKYCATEIGRKIVNDSMDVAGGSGISRGPKNLLANQYIASPIGITVEGANILTRTLIIFGQGALRAHPYAFREVNAVEKNDLKEFDSAFWGHIGHVVRNMIRSVVLSVTRGYLASSPVGGSVSKYYRKLSWVSASFAIMADLAMGTLGGQLKIKEKITGRFADILSWMYISTAILRRFEAEGSKKEDLPFVHFTMNIALLEIQKAFDGIFKNLPVPGLSWFFRGPLRWWANLNALIGEHNDEHTHKIATLIMTDGELRNRITEGCFMPDDPNESINKLDNAFKIAKRSEEAEKKIRRAVKDGILPKGKTHTLVDAAAEKNVISAAEKQDMKMSVQVSWDVIQVDDFTQDEYLSTKSIAELRGGK